MEEEKGQVAQSLRAIARWIDNHQELLDDEVVQVIDDILSSHSKKTQVFLVAATQQRIKQLIRWMEAADAIDDRLCDPEIIAVMPVGELRKTAELIHNKIEAGVKFLQAIAEEKALPTSMEEKRAPTLPVMNETTDVKKRETVRSFMEKLKTISSSGTTIDVEKVPDADPEPPTE